VYRVDVLPDAAATADRWRAFCAAEGFGEIFLVAAQTFGISDPRPYGFDAAVEFPPHRPTVPPINYMLSTLNPGYRGFVYSYEDLAAASASAALPDYPLFKTVVPGWDNTPRRGREGNIFAFSSPAAYSHWLKTICNQTIRRWPADQRIVFVNAWNEWAEGAHLEPDGRYGYAYLQASADVLRQFPVADHLPRSPGTIPAHSSAIR
jgi:hypothetical protein